MLEEAPTTTTTTVPVPEVAEDGFEVRAVYSRETKIVQISPEQTIGEVKEVIAKATGCSSKQMKLMFKGLLAAPNKPELDAILVKATGLKKKAKILVVGAKEEDLEMVSNADKISSTVAFMAESSAMTATKKWCDEKEHKKIIEKGPPEDVMLGYRPGQEALPEGSFTGVLIQGKKGRLQIKPEELAVVVHYNDRSQHIPFSSISNVKSEEIPGYEQYHIVGLKVSQNRYVFIYWVPAQYISALKGAIIGFGF
eukprot:m.134591 g.134591  ORF g.134591 m.134591 type:complete len:253 (+) comp9648_c0_seq1:62-820(+)